jgi:hypothetical protein
MTGMVKEEILTRQMELGYSVENGTIAFDFLFFNKQELVSSATAYEFWNVEGQKESIQYPEGAVAYSMCQVPVILQASNEAYIDVHFANGAIQKVNGHRLGAENSQHIFQRDGMIHHLVVSVT